MEEQSTAESSRSVARHTTHTPPPRPSVPYQTHSDFSIEGEQVRESIGITNGRAHIDQSRAASAQQPNLSSASPIDVLKLIENNEQLSTLLTQGCGNRHDPHSDHRSEGVALHDPRYKEAEVQSGKTITSLIAAINLGKNHWHNTWDPLAEEAEKSVSPYISGPMRIGIVGETGQGKSCLIGSLLGDEGVVQTAKSGESLTRVILEYHHWADHDSRFKYRAIISLLPWESVQKRIETYFEHWNHGLLSHQDESEHEDEDEDGEQSPDPAGPDSPGADTETATGFFQALFRGDPHFEDEETMKEYLLSSERSPVRHDIRDQLIKRARDMYDELDCQDTNIYKRTTEELWHKLARFTHGRSADDSRRGCDAWPFAEVVKIGGPFALSEHIIIADTPGRNDLNRLARASVDDYLPSCSSVIIACNISRIISDDSLPNQIEKIQRHRPVTVVATFSEDVGLVPSRHTKLSPGEKHTYMRLHEKLKQLQNEELDPSAAEAILRNQLKQKHLKKAYV
ncbi:hypothetical protein J4E80_007268 [Alternaria sp. BMP 0032]|nr:hypothetical protein J4E80_007268 [Alternaria sp. BMP 0032]